MYITAGQLVLETYCWEADGTDKANTDVYVLYVSLKTCTTFML